MIVGQYRDLHPRVLLTLHGQGGSLAVECVLDTGFDGELTLPADAIRRLGAPFLYNARTRYADGSEKQTAVHEVVVEWDGELRTVQAFAEQNNPLLGAEMYAGCRLTVEAEEGGEVVIEPLD